MNVGMYIYARSYVRSCVFICVFACVCVKKRSLSVGKWGRSYPQCALHARRSRLTEECCSQQMRHCDKTSEQERRRLSHLPQLPYNRCSRHSKKIHANKHRYAWTADESICNSMWDLRDVSRFMGFSVSSYTDTRDKSFHVEMLRQSEGLRQRRGNSRHSSHNHSVRNPVEQSSAKRNILNEALCQIHGSHLAIQTTIPAGYKAAIVYRDYIATQLFLYRFIALPTKLYCYQAYNCRLNRKKESL